MAKEYLEFGALNKAEQEWYLRETWCYKCNEADLGIKDPVLYKENDQTFVEGKCVKCGEPQISQVVIKEING